MNRKFTYSNIHDWFFNLDEAVIKALELYDSLGTPTINLTGFNKPLIVGSGNAAVTGRVLFEGTTAITADESNFIARLDTETGIDGAVLISASGRKHAEKIAPVLKDRGLEVRLFTCNKKAPEEHVDEIYVFRSRGEPYTYNTSTYMGMVLGKTKEDPKTILDFIEGEVSRTIPDNLGLHDSYYIIVPEEFDTARELFMTKFDELFQPKISGRVFTFEQTKHAKTVVYSPKEAVVALGYKPDEWNDRKKELPIDSRSPNVAIPLPDLPSVGPRYGAFMAIGYYFLGQVQKANPPWFKENIVGFCERLSESEGELYEAFVDFNE